MKQVRIRIKAGVRRPAELDLSSPSGRIVYPY